MAKILYTIDEYLERKRNTTVCNVREELLEFIEINFSKVKLVEVFDLVFANYFEYPYLGTIVIDCEKDDELFITLNKKYGNPYNNAIENNAVFWVYYENAERFYEERDAVLEAWFGDDYKSKKSEKGFSLWQK